MATAPACPDNIRAPASPRGLELAIAWAVFVALAYLPNLAPERSIGFVSLMIFWAFFSMTLIILCDQITIVLQHGSLLQQATGSGKAWLSFVCVGALSGVLLDGIAQWLGKLWIYPYWNEAVYAATFVVGFCAYWLATAESYLAVRAILGRRCRVYPSSEEPLPRGRGSVSASFASRREPALHSPWRSAGSCGTPSATRPYEAVLFRALGIVGAVLTISGIVLLLHGYQRSGGYMFDTRTVLPVKNHFSYFLITFAGVWLVLEWVQFAGGRLSLLRTILNGNRLPLYSLLLASAVFALFWETVNAAHHFWIYTNWPLPQLQIMSVPVTVLLTWPLQYVVFLSLGFLLGRDLWP